MPELAAGYSVGFLMALLLGSLFTFLQMRKYRSESYKQVQRNLALVNLRWVDLEGRIAELGSQTTRQEAAKARTTYILFTAAATLFSWLGVVFLIVMWVSVEKLIRNRLQEDVFGGALAEKELTAAEVTTIWEQLQKTHMN